MSKKNVGKEAVRNSTESDSDLTQENGRSTKRIIQPLPNLLFSINDLAQMLKVSRSLIVYLMNKRKVAHCAIGKRKLFTSEQVEAFVERIKKNEFRAGIER